ncbi:MULTISPECIES: hypothetical protein [Synechocystis]|uniref:Uncharacterized protein n=1 Tax=Synechocystis salina LEGE 00031 TaxID=1828736 RepID=A0ABR9VV38_9SYNC|nr:MULTISPECIES: hypothetical protein [Synechocystis]MBD2653547.1 hypothetical protein [Synechocystis sp. FACHB-383]MBE9241486.1 hypothetical protein [Synechocystis salina LEGE 00041]MBE9254763.1 hypothetical protein [Synechocystis salina LEGE 00031]
MSDVHPWRSPWGEALIYGGLLLPLPLAHKMAETVGYNRTGFSWGFVCLHLSNFAACSTTTFV